MKPNEYLNNFPRIDSVDEKPDYPGLFPWGCDQLDSLAEFRPNSVYELQGTKLPYNIYIAIKYGIWSMPPIRYKIEYREYESYSDKSKYQKYLVFVCGNYVYGIAKVVGFDPDKSFKYWCYPQESLFGKHEGYYGIINLKFVRLGRCVLEKASYRQSKLLNEHTALRLWRGLKHEDLKLVELIKHDLHEDNIRTLISNSDVMNTFQSKFIDFHQNLKRKEVTSSGRESYNRCFYKQKSQAQKGE